MWGCFLMSGLKILHFLKDWWKSIPIHQNYTMALSIFSVAHSYEVQWMETDGILVSLGTYEHLIEDMHYSIKTKWHDYIFRR